MEAAWKMLQAGQPDDFIIATGEAHSVEEFVEEAFKAVNLKSKDYVFIDSKLLRPTKTSPLVGDISKAKEKLGYEPKIKFKELVKMMVEADLKKERSSHE